MPDSAHRMLRVAAARADFLDSGLPGAAGIPGLLAASWERSQQAGVDSAQPHSDFTEEIDTGSLLVRCARPVLRQLGIDTADVPIVIAVTDYRARLVQRIDTSSAVGRLLDRVDFAPGFSYSESTMGTNGVGTVLESGQPVSIVGPEHFAENLHAFACTGAPIIDPVTRRVEGVLDISTLSQSWSPLMHTLAKSAAQDIGRNLLLDRSQSQQAIFDTYLQVQAKATRQAVFAFGDSVFMANPAAEAQFDASEQRILRDHATFMMGHRDRASDTLELSTGRMVHVRGTRILAGSEVAGLVVIAETVAEPKPRSGEDFIEHVLPQVAIATSSTSRIAGDLGKPYDEISPGRSPAWLRACEDLRTALAERQPTVVVGETGTGKFTLVGELFHRTFPGARSVAIDAAEVTVGGDPADLEALLAADDLPTLHIVRNLDAASTAAAEQIDSFLARLRETRSDAWCVATLSDSALDSDLPFHPLLAHFEVSVMVPPLRCRTEDLAGIIDSLLRALAPHRRVRLSPEAQRLVARYSWPRNVAQLAEALEQALRRRPVGEIQTDDLPAYCQTATRHRLTPLETAERDAIVVALREHQGNRVAAAAHLGMARSSLYRKIKSYDIRA
ncbi:helix-turn-helix domain-containing protein [Nocardioides sp. LHD-245]|uniref:sigma-54-dependent Fis family transcriptional regulator n=1 Tax=Nocardioides sp. LHD-245 TaxID=3051387 RepID=UPI0027DFEDE7|nr:helix-turn-helix domain-containing protein [Nocardioides sp. LHD-245]